MEDRGVARAVADALAEVPVYKDGLQPAVKEMSKGLLVVAKAINVALTPLAGLVWGYEKVRAFVEEALARRLEGEEEHVKPPAPNIAVPALMALTYSGFDPTLREMYANLIATSMHDLRSESAHPAFVQLIQQLSPDEARILLLLSIRRTWPLISVDVHSEEGDTFRPGQDFYSNISELAGCRVPEDAPRYIVNLQRLGLVSLYMENPLSRDEWYPPLESSSFVKEIEGTLKKMKHKSHIQINRGSMSLTSFGRIFCDACVEWGEYEGLCYSCRVKDLSGLVVPHDEVDDGLIEDEEAKPEASKHSP